MTFSLPPDPSLLSAARAAAEDAGDDGQLLHTRSLERASEALPPIVDGARRSRLIHADAISTTWEAWDTGGGERMLLRCLRVHWRDDPVMRRRMARAVGQITPSESHSGLSWHPDGDWPHLRVVINGSMLADRFPVEDPPVTSRMARILAGGLQSLAQLHDKGLSHGGPLVRFLVERPAGASIVWLDTFDASRPAVEDISELARTVAALDPHGEDPVAELAREWMDDPPPTAADALALLFKALGGHLLAARHHLAVVGRKRHQADRASRLAAAVRRLTGALPPPVTRTCLRATAEGVCVLAESDGSSVRGGATVEAGDRFLSLVYDPQQGLDAQAARYLLRAWATRSSGDTTARQAAQVELGSTDADAERLIRWLSGMARLRAARLLLEAAHRPHRQLG